MHKVENLNGENTILDKEFIIKNLGLIPKDNSDFFILTPDSANKFIGTTEMHPINTQEGLAQYFEGLKVIKPDNICRPKGDTTFFTTAGVQHIETMIRETGLLERGAFVVAQPVIRSQYMDKIKEGYSTSFINFSAESVGGTPDEFIEVCNQFINLVTDQGGNTRQLEIQIQAGGDTWGKRKFSQTYLTVYFAGIELGECVYIHDYPVSDTEKTSIIDVSFGVERLNWGIGKSEHYFQGFEKFYKESSDVDKTASLIDSVRTAVLIAGEGIKPSHYDPGYRLRQLIKRFVARKQGLTVDIDEMINISYKYWQKWGIKPISSEEEVRTIINTEVERSYNVSVLAMLENRGGPKIQINVNQPTADFFKQVNLLPKETKRMIFEIAEEIK